MSMDKARAIDAELLDPSSPKIHNNEYTMFDVVSQSLNEIEKQTRYSVKLTQKQSLNNFKSKKPNARNSTVTQNLQ